MAHRRHAHARTAPRIPFAVLGVTFPLASAFSMVGEHARLGGSRRMKSPPWHTLWTLFKRSQWLNQHLQGIVTRGRQVRARGPSRRRNASVRDREGRAHPTARHSPQRGRRAQEPLLINIKPSLVLPRVRFRGRIPKVEHQRYDFLGFEGALREGPRRRPRGRAARREKGEHFAFRFWTK